MPDHWDSTTMTEILKKVYSDEETEKVFLRKKVTWNSLPEAKADIGGLGWVESIQYGNSQGIGGTAEGETLRQPTAAYYDKTTIQPRSVYGRTRISGLLMAKARQSKQTFVNAVSGLQGSTMDEFVFTLNRMCHGDGFGKLCTLSAASDAVTTSGTTTWTVTADNDEGMLYVRPGMVVDFYDGPNIDQSSVASQVSTVDIISKTVEMNPNDGSYKTGHPITAAQSYTITTDAVPDAAVMVIYGTRNATHATSDTPRELTGLQGIVDDGTLLSSFQDITVATAPYWKANILSNSGSSRALSLDLMIQASQVSTYNGGKPCRLIRTGLGQQRKYFNLLKGDVRFAPQKFAGGFKTVTFAAGDGDMNILIDPLVTPGRMYFEPEGGVKKYILDKPQWMNRAGLWQSLLISDKDEFECCFYMYGNLGTKCRNSLTLLSDLIEPNRFS